MIYNLTGIETTKTQRKEEISKSKEHVAREEFSQLYLYAV